MNHFSQYPYQNYSDYNLDWLMLLVKEVNKKLSEYLENAVITFADPITWNITEQYTALTCVVDSDGTAYLSKQPVPAGVDISNTNYWLPIFNYDDNINTLRSQIAYNARNSATIGQALQAGDLVFWNGLIYQALIDMPAGTALIIDSNIRKFTVDEKFSEFDTEISTLHQHIDDEEDARINADNTLQQHIDDEEDARINADSTLQQHIDDEEDARINADDTLQQHIDDEEAARIHEDGVLQGLIDAIDSRVDNLKKEFVYPEDYGAVGDGAADDTAAIQAALNNTDHLPVRFSKKYLVTNTIIVPSNTVMMGMDGAEILDRKPAGSGYQSSTTFYIADVDNVFISGITFRGSGTSTAYASKYLILGQSATNITIANSKFYNYEGISFIYAVNCRYVYVYRCYFKEYTRGAVHFVEGTSFAGVFYSSVINGHETNTPNRYPIMLCGYDRSYDADNPAPQGRDLYAIGNYIVDSEPWWEGIDAHGGNGLYISDNEVVGVACPIAVFTNVNRGFSVAYAFIHDNKFIASRTATTNPGTRYGCAFGGTSMFIHDNYFSNGGCGYPDNMSAGVYFDFGIDLHFYNNTVNHSIRSALFFSGQYNAVTIHNNYIDGVYGDALTKYGIEFNSGSTLGRIEIKGNRFEGTMTHIKAINSGSTQLIRLSDNDYIGIAPTFENPAYLSPDKITAAQMTGTAGRNGDIAINTTSGTPLWIMRNSNGYSGNWIPFGNIFVGARVAVSITMNGTIGWQQTNATIPAVTGYTCVGAMCQTDTDRILAPWWRDTNVVWWYNRTAETRTTTISMYPIYRMN